MILRILLLSCAMIGIHALGGMLDPFDLKYFEKTCFQTQSTDPFRINGQETPLANSMDNFISLAEKFEAANPNSITLKDELFYFLKNYTFENIQITTEGLGSWAPSLADFTDIDRMWEDNVNENLNKLRNLNDPFSDDEKCSLYYMISHSLVDKTKDVQEMRSMGNISTSSRIYRTELNIDDYFPQEIGVVAVRGSEEAVSVSRVLVGMYVGLKDNREKDLRDYDRVKNAVNVPSDSFPPNTKVDSLYALTMAEVLMLSAWTMSNRRGLARDGSWLANPLDIAKFCPMVYKQKDNGVLPAYSYSSVRGAADGLILGTLAKSMERKKMDAKLSQILRMYYSREGIYVEEGASIYLPTPRTVSFCNRRETVDLLSADLDDQMKAYGFLVSKKFEYQKNFDNAKDLYTREKDLIYRVENQDLNDYCNLKLERVEDMTKESFLDVIVVMDSGNQDVAFKTQQLITGYLASLMDLRYTGSRMTILQDTRINTDSSSVTVELQPVVLDEHSSSCAACKVGQILFKDSSIERELVVQAVDQLLAERKTNETSFHGTNGKVVLFFNFESDSRGSDRFQGKLNKALQDLFTRHPDANFYAVGLESDSLKKYARNDPAAIELSNDGDEQSVAKKVYAKISKNSGLLQYSDCNDGRGEGSAIYENFVSPNAVQHWQMPAEYFYKSTHLKITFEAPNGLLKVCYNRATKVPENEAASCNVTVNNNRLEYHIPNPCKSFTKEQCSPFYFAVIGQSPNGDANSIRQRDAAYCSDLKLMNYGEKWCPKLDSVKFKVSHEGVRCSGCLGIGATPLVALFTILFSYIFHKMF